MVNDGDNDDGIEKIKDNPLLSRHFLEMSINSKTLYLLNPSDGMDGECKIFKCPVIEL